MVTLAPVAGRAGQGCRAGLCRMVVQERRRCAVRWLQLLDVIDLAQIFNLEGRRSLDGAALGIGMFVSGWKILLCHSRWTCSLLVEKLATSINLSDKRITLKKLDYWLVQCDETTSSPTQCSAATQLSSFVDAITVTGQLLRIEIGVLAAGCGARRGRDVPRLKRGGRGVRVVGVVTPSGPGPKTIGSRSTPKNCRFNYLRICIVQEKIEFLIYLSVILQMELSEVAS
ncbi:uncharacterized protein [Lolium perenne]|uniref:uncharacterized protein isoform X1 n=1 Tax=Lolium perenne TaxID=4522 RepID=UPI0021F580ED|nr:uncharacterized protein LOC127308626 isoform X1 [Lolium perenne]